MWDRAILAFPWNGMCRRLVLSRYLEQEMSQDTPIRMLGYWRNGPISIYGMVFYPGILRDILLGPESLTKFMQKDFTFS